MSSSRASPSGAPALVSAGAGARSEQQFSLLPKVVNGGIAGIVGVTVIFPVDLCKTRLQNQQTRQYTSIYDCARQTLRNEGFLGLYRGLAVNVLLITPEKAIKLVANDYFRFNFRNSKGELPLLRGVAAGGCAGALQIVVTTPMELLKVQLQDAGRVASRATGSDGAPAARMSASRIAAQLVRERGLLGLYKGFTPTFLRDVSFSMLYFPLFAHVNELGKQYTGHSENVFYVSFCGGLFSACVAAFLVTPLDVVKTRLQTLRAAAGERQYTGVAQCFAGTWRAEGARAFFKGGLARVLVIAPLFAIAQMVYFLGIAERLLGAARPDALH